MKEKTLLEQMIKVRPKVLDENALKLFNKIMEVIDERDKLREENKRLKEEYMLLQNASDEYEDSLQARITRAIECIKDFEIQAKHINDEIYLDETLSNKLLEILGGKE